MTNLLRVWAWFLDTPERELANIALKMPRDFLVQPANAREFRAIASMYKDGVLPIEVVFTYMRNAGVIPAWISEARFTELLESRGSFPGQADVQARQAGFADAAAQREAGGLLN